MIVGVGLNLDGGLQKHFELVKSRIGFGGPGKVGRGGCEHCEKCGGLIVIATGISAVVYESHGWASPEQLLFL